MPLLKPDMMNDILSTPELSRIGLSDSTKSNNIQQILSRQHSPPSMIRFDDNNCIIRDSNCSINNNNNQNNSNNINMNEKRTLPERIPAFGLLMAILSVFCFSIASVIVRIVVTLPTIEILVWRSLCQFVVYFMTTLAYGYDFFGQNGHRIDLFVRSISGTISLSAVYIAYRLIPLSDASTIHFASPVFVTVFAYFLLKEPLTKLQIITGTITLTGVFIISKPEFIFGSESDVLHEMRLEGIILSVIASMTAAFSMIFLRKLKTTPVAVVVMWYSFTQVLCGSLYLTIANKWTIPDKTTTWCLLIAIGICGILDQYCITLAFQYEKAGPISVVRTFNIVLSFLWEVLLLNENIEWTSILGACLICSCVIVLTLVKWYKESPESFDRIRRKFCCFCPMPGPSKINKKSSHHQKKNKSINSLNRQQQSKTNNANNNNNSNAGQRNFELLKHHHHHHNDDDYDYDIEANSTINSTSKKLSGSNESIDSIMVQNTVNSNAILLVKSSSSDDE